jgi:hypothetical protein
MNSVPDYFQEESGPALRAQAAWLDEHLGLGDPFFSRFLRVDQGVVADWRSGSAVLSRDQEAVWLDWWHTVLHLLSFQGFDVGKVRAMLEQTPAPAPAPAARSIFSPPWSVSLKDYLERHGHEALAEVDRWVESFRLGDPYVPRQGGPCLSTRP